MGHFPYKLRDLEMDYYGVSLHKWLLAPLGTGFLYVRSDRIANDVAAAGRAASARQRHPQVRGDRHRAGGDQGGDQRGARVPPGDRHRAQGGAPALPDAALGEPAEAEPAHQDPLEPRPGQTAWRWSASRASRRAKIDAFLWDKYRIITTPIHAPDYNGIRVTPNIYTPLEEIDTFVRAMEDLLKNGLPATA